jgi:hypothetical protein
MKVSPRSGDAQTNLCFILHVTIYASQFTRDCLSRLCHHCTSPIAIISSHLAGSPIMNFLQTKYLNTSRDGEFSLRAWAILGDVRDPEQLDLMWTQDAISCCGTRMSVAPKFSAESARCHRWSVGPCSTQ